jgi:outer membrane protein OmpA-like peptidoglycan-associated protein
MSKTAEDNAYTTHWAIASLAGGGFIVGYNAFDLVNRDTGRGHQLHLTSGGLNTQLGSAGASEPGYTYFQTKKPANFDTFDGAGARLTSANIGVVWGYNLSYLTIWDGPAYIGDLLAKMRMSGWGAMIPGGSAGAHGVLAVSYGSGRPAGHVARHAELKQEFKPDKRLARVKHKPSEDPALRIPSDVLFKFGSYAIEPEGENLLRSARHIINNRARREVTIIGHTDSIGTRAYNMHLSLQRAATVKAWMVRNGAIGADGFATRGRGELEPVAANSKRDGSDNPEGRKQNRRVEIHFGN